MQNFFISGGAPLSKEIAEFFFMAGFRIIEGYGLSETCILSVNRLDRIRFGSVGIPFERTEIKTASDGEILVRGPQVMKGYYKKPQETADVLTADGWLHTGDIGELDGDGFLKITDRKKELIATAAGKKIAPQPIENQLKGDSLVESACVVGESKKYLAALIVPNLEFCQGWARAKGFELKNLSDCANNPQLRTRFEKIVADVNEKLPRYATLKDFRLLTAPFSQETGELTPTLKLKRRVIHEKYSKLIDEMYPEDTESIPSLKSHLTNG